MSHVSLKRIFQNVNKQNRVKREAFACKLKCFRNNNNVIITTYVQKKKTSLICKKYFLEFTFLMYSQKSL